MPLYIVSFDHNTGLVRAVDRRDAQRHMEREIGMRHAPIDIELATEEDEDWFNGMGGSFVHETTRHHNKGRQ